MSSRVIKSFHKCLHKVRYSLSLFFSPRMIHGNRIVSVKNVKWMDFLQLSHASLLATLCYILLALSRKSLLYLLPQNLLFTNCNVRN